MVSVHELTVHELKEILRMNGQPTGGTKTELISRLMTADPTGSWLRSDGESRDGNDGAELAMVMMMMCIGALCMRGGVNTVHCR